MIEIKTADEIELMRQAGRITAAALAAVRDAAAVGVRLDALDEIAADVIADAGAEALFLGYHPGSARTPYPGVTCISVNDAVVHGIPGRYRLAAGDLVSVDCGARYRGWSGDAALSFIVGEHPDPRVTRSDEALIATTRTALDAGIAAARPGGRLGDVAHAIGRVARAAGYGLMANHGGHGIGREMHEAPNVPNEGRPGRGLVLRSCEHRVRGDEAGWWRTCSWSASTTTAPRSCAGSPTPTATGSTGCWTPRRCCSATPSRCRS